MSNLLKNIIRFFLFILVQAYILDKVPPLHRFVKPSLYFLFIIWLPFSVPRSGLLLLAFVYGLCMDYFSGTPGLHASACLMIAYVRPFLLNILLPQETTELSYYEPSIKSIGWAPYLVYVLMLTFIHHTVLVLLEYIQSGNFLFFIGKIAASTALSIVLIFITEMLFYRKARFKTNAA
jgi:rod shape-determining protein MreD